MVIIWRTGGVRVAEVRGGARVGQGQAGVEAPCPDVVVGCEWTWMCGILTAAYIEQADPFFIHVDVTYRTASNAWAGSVTQGSKVSMTASQLPERVPACVLFMRV